MTMSATAHRGDSRAPSTRNRLIGIDIARFIAVLGMFNIHFGVPFVDGLAEVKAAQFSSGRSTALFTLLAGVSLALLSGRQEPPTGIALRQARWRIAVRAALLVVIGIVLAKATEATGFLLTVIIPFYGMYFLLSLPFVGLRSRGLLVAAGTAAGGWKIIRTLGHRMVRLQPVHGFAAETTAAMVIQVASHMGIPLSTTHVISASIMDVGATRRLGAVKWSVVARMVWTWVLTIPATGLLGYVLERFVW